MPEISVVVPSRDRETRLAFALDALASQTIDRARFEVIVVRAEEAAGEPLTRSPRGLEVRYLSSPVSGTAAQRNLGWRAAAAPLIAFSDDDCRAAPDWLEGLLAARRGEDTILQGRTEPDPDERQHLLGGIARTIHVPEATGWYETCNIAYPRALLERLGGFDEAFGFLGEDTDLGLRARAAGAELRFVDRALVWHAVYWRNLPRALRDARARAPLPALIARYPAQRRALWLRVFSNPSHIRLLAALGGLLVARWSPVLGALAAFPYLRKEVDVANLNAWRLLRLPALVLSRAAVDLAEIVTLAGSSARHRALVL
jgi:glycosyltransferase involved in cell wall biosynthesis